MLKEMGELSKWGCACGGCFGVVFAVIVAAIIGVIVFGTIVDEKTPPVGGVGRVTR